jgi:hypothetical protein
LTEYAPKPWVFLADMFAGSLFVAQQRISSAKMQGSLDGVGKTENYGPDFLDSVHLGIWP